MEIRHNIKRFLEENIDLIDNSDFEELYRRAYTKLNRDCGKMTQLLMSLNIDPLKDLTYIPDNYLRNTDIKEFKIPEHIQTIGMDAFKNSEIESVVIPGNVEQIHMCAFNGCPYLSTLVIEYGCESISRFVFSECENLVKVVLPESITWIDREAFDFCPNLKTIEYKGMVAQFKEIDTDSCWCDTKLEKVKCLDGDINYGSRSN